MNFVDMEVESDRDGAVLTAPGLRIPLENGSAQVRAVVGRRRVTAGIRPEHIHDPQFTPNRSQTVEFSAVIDLEERLGNETFLHAKAGPNTLLARVSPQTSARAGSEFRLALEPLRLHLFDAESGARLEPQAERPNGEKVYAHAVPAEGGEASPEPVR